LHDNRPSARQNAVLGGVQPIKLANLALRLAKTPNLSQQYQYLTSAETVLLFKSGLNPFLLDRPSAPDGAEQHKNGQ
jgi:hypothetical protein